ncbi:NADP-dependent isocitrate dehydrogenase [Pseudomonas aeruginosa]|nr:NADP-dependent isocitrate dehydrogenase [Pseudomonas aeruginosa]
MVPLMAGRRHVRNRRRRPARHVQLWWKGYLLDSLGEFLALAVSLEETGIKTGSAKAKLLGKALDEAAGNCWTTTGRRRARSATSTAATSTWRCTGQGPGRPGRRRRTESALRTAGQGPDRGGGSDHRRRTGVRSRASATIEIGYYRSNPELTSKVMRPSATFNAAIDSLATTASR